MTLQKHPVVLCRFQTRFGTKSERPRCLDVSYVLGNNTCEYLVKITAELRRLTGPEASQVLSQVIGLERSNHKAAVFCSQVPSVRLPGQRTNYMQSY